MIGTAILAMLAAGACIEVSGPAILARHLQAAIPELAGIDGAAEFGFAPAPGATRWIRKDSLASFASRHGVHLGAFGGVCVTRRTRILTAEEVLQAGRRALDNAGSSSVARLEVLDYSRLPAPEGELLLAARDLKPDALGVAIWKGRIRYETNRSVAFWARVRVFMDGLPISTPAAEGPAAIQAGEIVSVVSESGPVRIAVEAKALRSGRPGELIELEVVDGKRRLRARVAAPGQAVAIPQETKQ